MKKSEHIEAQIASLHAVPDGLHPCYADWFARFNAGAYYEAHDVLEYLWLRTRGKNYAFYKGLIQISGAFVHLKKQHARPWHVKDGARLRPAARLFRIALANLLPYSPLHERLDVRVVCKICEDYLLALEAGNFTKNPWSPDRLPAITPLDSWPAHAAG